MIIITPALATRGWGGGIEVGKNNGTSAYSYSHAESSLRLKKLTEGAVAAGLGGLFKYLTTCIEKHDFFRLGVLQNFEG